MLNEPKYDLEELSKKISNFCVERDWEQYHNPKNLSMALAVEASELMEIFQWLTIAQSQKESLSPKQLRAVEEEIADVMIYAIRMSQVLGVELLSAIADKLKKNEVKYPVAKIKGKASLD